MMTILLFGQEALACFLPFIHASRRYPATVYIVACLKLFGNALLTTSLTSCKALLNLRGPLEHCDVS